LPVADFCRQSTHTCNMFTLNRVPLPFMRIGKDFPIFKGIKSMKKFISREQVRLYLIMTLIFSAFVLLNEFINYRETFGTRVVNNTWLLVFVIVNNFILFEFTIPFLTRSWKRMLMIPVFLFFYLILYSYGFYLWRGLGILIHYYTAIGTFKSLSKALEFLSSYSIGSVFIFGIIRHIYHYNKLKQSAQQLRIEKQEAELNYLKSQTNPHFLFNTLNNIYSLSRDKSDLAPESILRLSKILRFMLYETGGAYIAIEQELKIISDYIALEKLRYDESLQVNFNYDIEDMKQAIPPLLLIPLVENAFKHGVSETRQRPYVDIHLSVRQRQLNFTVKNSTESFAGEKTVKESIGLANLRRQLELLYTDYSLIVQQGESDFTALLKINLSSHV
jgi:sensor histidine kinase YesM